MFRDQIPFKLFLSYRSLTLCSGLSSTEQMYMCSKPNCMRNLWDKTLCGVVQSVVNTYAHRVYSADIIRKVFS